MDDSKTILITGASGFLGSWLAKEAFRAGYRLIGIDLRGPTQPEIWAKFSTSSCEVAEWGQLLEGESLYAVCYLAGGASVAASVSDPYADFSSLLPGLARVATFIGKYQSQARIFLFSSAAVYGNPNQLPITENTPILPISPYGIHKAMGETLLLNYSRIFDINVTILRIFSVYGPGLRKQLIWDINQRIASALKNGQHSIPVMGTGKESRDFIYVNDLCNAIIILLSKTVEDKFEIYNIASGIESSIEEVVSKIITCWGSDVSINFGGKISSGDPANWRTDISKLVKTGFFPKYTLNEGLREVVNWTRSVFES